MTKRSTKAIKDKQKAFVNAYLSCWNGAEAARRAGYSARTARIQASVLLTNPNIRAAIQKRLEKQAMSADEVLSRLGELARSDMRDFVVTDKHGDPAGFDLSEDKPLHVVKKLSITTDTFSNEDGELQTTKRVTFELHDAHAALVKLGEYHRLFTQRIEVDDWREEARREGIKDPDSLFEHAKREYEKRLARPDVGGSVAGSEAHSER